VGGRAERRSVRTIDMKRLRPTALDFGPVAKRYDRWYDTAQGAVYDRLEKRAVERFLPENAEGMKLLEVGCGTGHWTRFFAERGLMVMGVDYSRSMIEVARSKNIPNASFAVADAHALPFEAERFDVAASITMLEFVRDPETVVSEMVRCVRHGGGLIMIAVLNALAGVNRRRKAAERQPYLDARFFSPRELLGMLEHHGRTGVISAGYVPASAWLLRMAPFLDSVGRLLHLRYGALLIGSLEL